jgi:hypothetical protein
MNTYSPHQKKPLWQVLLSIAIVAGFLIFRPRGPTKPQLVPSSSPAQRVEVEASVERSDCDAVLAAWQAKRSDVIVECEGRVSKVLPDDNEGSRHQKFIVAIPGGPSVLFAHNIDLAQRAPVKAGAVIGFRGEYEWTEKGGVIHWTHRDPAGRHAGGWLRVEGQLYR